MKQVIVANEALHLPRGKLAAQAAHAAVAAYLEAGEEARLDWWEEGMPKVVLKVAQEQDLLGLYERALAAGLPAALIEDAGRTVVPEGTLTCLGIGPAPDGEIDALTGELKLL